MNNKKIFIAGHKGLVGSAIHRHLLEKEGISPENIITKDRKELDLLNSSAVRDFFHDPKTKPDHIYLAAAKVGGIYANQKNPVEFLLENIKIQTNIIESAYHAKVEKLLFLGSSCIYPKNAPQPILEEYLLTSELEVTNEAYALAKITGLKLCQYYRNQYGCQFFSAMPCNVYGPNDNYDLNTSHVLPALIRKIHEAKTTKASSFTLWGTGKPLREFIYSDDLAEGLVFIMKQNFLDVSQFPENLSHINIGSGKEISILDLSSLIKKIIGFEGDLVYDDSKPDGTPRKIMDSSKLNKMGWKAKVSIEKGIELAYKAYLQ